MLIHAQNGHCVPDIPRWDSTGTLLHPVILCCLIDGNGIDLAGPFHRGQDAATSSNSAPNVPSVPNVVGEAIGAGFFGVANV